jgi:EmrB/QacA subfamily drug resistance transporter
MSQPAPPCDRALAAVAGASPPPQGRRGGAMVVAGTVLGSSLAFIDSSAVNLILPIIQQRLGGGAAAAQWIMNGYLLMLGALVLAGGAAADRYGRRRIFAIGATVFSAASLACGLAPSLPALIAARAVQGCGAALLTPASLALLGAAFDAKGRSRAVGVWAAASGLTSALGPLLGGWLADAVSWRAVFLINLPVAGAAVAFVLAGAAESRSETSGPVDVAGALTVTLGLAAVTWALTEAPALGLANPKVIAGLAVSVASLAGFLWIERRSPAPMLPLKLFGSVTFSGANALTLLLYAAFGGALFVLPFQLIRALHYPPTLAGAALLPLSVGLAVMSPIAGRLVHAFGARLLLSGGPLLVAAGFAILAVSAPDAAYWSGLFPGLAALAVGMGLTVAPLTDAVLGAVDPAYEGAAAGVNNAVARVAGLLAVALAGFVLVQGAAPATAVTAGYRTAMIAAAVCAAGAGLIGALTIRKPVRG